MSDYPRVLALRPPRLLTGCLRAPARPGAESVRGNRMDRGRRGVAACVPLHFFAASQQVWAPSKEPPREAPWEAPLSHDYAISEQT